jgi:hypothetical protein
VDFGSANFEPATCELSTKHGSHLEGRDTSDRSDPGMRLPREQHPISARPYDRTPRPLTVTRLF